MPVRQPPVSEARGAPTSGGPLAVGFLLPPAILIVAGPVWFVAY
jgi:hypothetical protein